MAQFANTISENTFGTFRLSYPSSIIVALEKTVTPSLVVLWDLRMWPKSCRRGCITRTLSSNALEPYRMLPSLSSMPREEYV